MVVRFPLEMKNGVKVREINKFKEHFDIEIVISHFLNGKLLKWLENWNYEEEAKAISVLTKEDPELVKKLCEIFNVEYVIGNIVDVEKIV